LLPKGAWGFLFNLFVSSLVNIHPDACKKDFRTNPYCNLLNIKNLFTEINHTPVLIVKDLNKQVR
jgi:hypothetical protein